MFFALTLNHLITKLSASDFVVNIICDTVSPKLHVLSRIPAECWKFWLAFQYRADRFKKLHSKRLCKQARMSIGKLLSQRKALVITK